MTRTIALRLCLLASLAAPFAAGCEAPPQREINDSRELPDPKQFVGDWKAYHNLGKRHSEQAYKLSETSRKVYHFDQAIVAFQRAKSMRETTLRELPDVERAPVQNDIALIQGYLERCYSDRPVYYGPAYRPQSRRN